MTGLDLRNLAFAALIASVPTFALAASRDEVMSDAYRCAAIADSRTWLDCYYGAARAQRANLGMPPPLPAQLGLVASPPLGGAINDQTARAEVMVAASQCHSITDDRRWLDCYYGAAATIRGRLGLAISPQPQRQLVPAPAPEHSGSPTLHGKIAARIVSFRFDRSRNFTVTLANGQVWRQVAGDTAYAHWDKQAANSMATITPGAFGSFNLQVKDNPQLFKVQRVHDNATR